jgi:hypothetical protein
MTTTRAASISHAAWDCQSVELWARYDSWTIIARIMDQVAWRACGRTMMCVFLSVAGCDTQLSRDSWKRFDSPLYARRPEIRHVEGEYQLGTFQKDPASLIVTANALKVVGNDLHVFVLSRGTFPGSPQFMPLNVPDDFLQRDMTNHFFWQDPDGTLHPLVVREGQAPANGGKP